ncbi:MAG TPA: hypothetical protein VJ714_06695 [Anaerolineae bacterium]|jgi:hypothetical protein|nr:hypothetical protein [Anaerolineae bacterium]
MTVVIELIDNFAIWIYIACALTILVYLRVIYLAKRERGASLFTIEKEVATGRAYRAIFTIVGLLLIVSLVALVDLYLAPSLGIVVGSSTPEGPIVLSTPTDTPRPPTPTISPTRGPLVRPTPPWTPTPEASPTVPVVPASCPDPKVRITYPGVNQAVGGVVEIRGTATIEDFGYYKVEFGFGEGGSEFHVIDDLKYSPVENGVLVAWPTGDLSGPVTLRLTVVKSDGNYPTPCEVSVVVRQG